MTLKQKIILSLLFLIVHIFLQFFFSNAKEELEKDSGIVFQRKEVTEFCNGILQGNWDLVEKSLPIFQLEGETLMVIY